MGDRGNILVKLNKDDNGVYLYSHWSGSELPQILRGALAKRWRWDDCKYLTRIIFDTMTKGEQGKETGYGISSYLDDGDNRVLEVTCEEQVVSHNGSAWTFEEYILLPDGLAGW